MTFYNKIKWVLGILIVFVLIFTTNMIDRYNFMKVKDSVVTIYEDRLIANDLIFELSGSVQQKELAVVTMDTLFFQSRNSLINESIEKLIARYEATKLTTRESRVFEQLKENLASLKLTEDALSASDFSEKEELLEQISMVRENLNDLSKIQLNEGGRQMSISKQALDTVDLFTKIEIYLLIFLAIVIQIIIIYKPKEAN